MNSLLVIPMRFERMTHALEGRCSIQLSYGTILNCDAKIRAFFISCNSFDEKNEEKLYFFFENRGIKRGERVILWKNKGENLS